MLDGMARQPGGDKSGRMWNQVLAHRPEGARDEVRERFEAAGLMADRVQAVLADCGDALYAAACSGRDDWWQPFGGPLAVALLAAEVSALAAHLNSRGSAVRSLAVNGLLDEFSAVTVATRLGVSRQKVYEIGRAGVTTSYIDETPWRRG